MISVQPAAAASGLPHLPWEAMPRSSVSCTLAVLCRNVGRSRDVRAPLPGHRQFADPAREKAYLRTRQTSHGLGCDREPSRERGSRRRVPSTSTSNRAQAKYCVGCRTRQKERKQQPRQPRDSMGPPTSVVIALRIGGAKPTGATIEPKTSKNLPTDGFLPGLFALIEPFSQRQQKSIDSAPRGGERLLSAYAQGAQGGVGQNGQIQVGWDGRLRTILTIPTAHSPGVVAGGCPLCPNSRHSLARVARPLSAKS